MEAFPQFRFLFSDDLSLCPVDKKRTNIHHPPNQKGNAGHPNTPSLYSELCCEGNMMPTLSRCWRAVSLRRGWGWGWGNLHSVCCFWLGFTTFWVMFSKCEGYWTHRLFYLVLIKPGFTKRTSGEGWFPQRNQWLKAIVTVPPGVEKSMLGCHFLFPHGLWTAPL